MNIPLNIDWRQILLHLLNFSILTLGLYLLLYDPVKKFMDERSEHYSKLDIKAQEKLKHAEDLELFYNERLKSAEAVIEEKKVNTEIQLQQEADLLLRNTKEEAAKLISDAQNTAQNERAKILQDSQQEIADMAIAAAEKILSQSASGALDQFLADVKKE